MQMVRFLIVQKVKFS